MLRPRWSALITALFTLLLIQLTYYLLNKSLFAARRERCLRQDAVEAIEEGETLQEALSERAKAVIFILARNTDLSSLGETIPSFEQRFNSKFNYPYVILNDVPFTEEFVAGVRKLTKSKVDFGTIPKEHWSYPSWVNVTLADENREQMGRRGIVYGDSLSYRHMCRFNSGFFFQHPLLDGYEYYWRVEPHVKFLCDVNYDPFVFMKKNNKKYGFNILMVEYWETIPTLWRTTVEFMKDHTDYITEQNSLRLIANSSGGYNTCHFWSNFEIASLDLWRSKKYLDYFEYLDKTGGFFYERWGDAPVHSMAAAMFLPIEQIHYFGDIGYNHGYYSNCPMDVGNQLRCSCDPLRDSNVHFSCLKLYCLFSKGSLHC
jgi:alpha 1,2-mannosyltransferase